MIKETEERKSTNEVEKKVIKNDKFLKLKKE
jgi:hypothetical protein